MITAYLLDAWAFLALLQREDPAASRVRNFLQDAEVQLVTGDTELFQLQGVIKIEKLKRHRRSAMIRTFWSAATRRRLQTPGRVQVIKARTRPRTPKRTTPLTGKSYPHNDLVRAGEAVHPDQRNGFLPVRLFFPISPLKRHFKIAGPCNSRCYLSLAKKKCPFYTSPNLKDQTGREVLNLCAGLHPQGRYLGALPQHRQRSLPPHGR